MEHEHGLVAARPFIQKAHPCAAGGDEASRREGINLLQPGRQILPSPHRRRLVFLLHHHSSASIMQLRPLPMPSMATRSPSPTAPASAASASVAGKETEPMLPSVSKVEKS